MDKRVILGKTIQGSPFEELLEKFKSRLAASGKKSLNLDQKRLNFLCLEFDPYNSLELSPEEKNIIEEYELEESLKNPFDFTNIVLQMMDVLEAEIKSRPY